MTDARTMRALVLALTALAFTACKSEAPAEPPAAPAPPEAPSEPEAPARLVASGEYVFGLPVPEGAVEEDRGRTHVHFDIDAPRELVVGFFRNELPDFAPTEYREGVKLEASDASDRSIYVYGDGDEVLLTYFDETPGEDPAARNSAEALRNILDERQPDRRIATDGSALVTANRGGRPQGPIGATPRRTQTDPRPRWARSDDDEFAGARERPGTSTAVTANTPSSPSGSQRDGSTANGDSDSNGAGANAGGSDTTIRRVQPVRQRPARGTTNPAGTRPIDFVHGTYEPPRNPNAYY